MSRLPPLPNELYEFYPVMSASHHQHEVQKYAADHNAALLARVAELEGALRPFAERRTTAELMVDQPPEWVNATPEDRIRMMGERKRANDDAILHARATLTKEPTVERTAK